MIKPSFDEDSSRFSFPERTAVIILNRVWHTGKTSSIQAFVHLVL